MSDITKDDRIVALASALIVARGAGDVTSAMTALQDAKHLLTPSPANKAYKAWQSENGLVPTTPEEDAEKSQRVAKNRAALMQRLA